jgi:hypothetical protein
MVRNDGVICNEGVVGKYSVNILDTGTVTASEARQSSFKAVDCFTVFAMTAWFAMMVLFAKAALIY